MKKSNFFRRKNIKKQVKRRHYRYVWRIGLSLALLLALGWGVRWGLQHWELFSIRERVVLGNPKTLSPQQILKRVGIPQGANLFQVDLNQAQQTLRDHPFFKRVSVRRRLPRTLVIEVEEYRPEFVLYTGRFYYLDASGEIFKDITTTQDSRDFVILTGFKESELLMTPQRLRKLFQKATGLKQAYQKTEFAKQLGLSEIHFEKNIGFILYPEKKKYSIKFGNQDFGEKTKKLTQVLEKLQEAKVQFSSIDLNYPGKVLMTL